MNLKRLLLLPLLLLCAITGHAQGIPYQQIALANVSGVIRPLANVPISVCTQGGTGIPCSPTVSIFSDVGLTQPITQPGFTTDANGNFSFFIAPGIYTYSVGSSALAPGGGIFKFAVGTANGSRVTSQIFTGNGTFTIPASVQALKVTVIGGGGAGGGSTAANTGSGGGAGSAAIKWLSGLTPGNTLTVTVGTGGTGVSGATGNVGTASSVSSGTQTITTIATFGGQGGVVTGASSPGSLDTSVSTGGDINLVGSGGFLGTATIGGNGGNSLFGGGGRSAGQAAGVPGVNPGSGGGGSGSNGAGNAAGGAGANGIVIFEWVN